MKALRTRAPSDKNRSWARKDGLWADASELNIVDIAGLPPGGHKVKIELVDANHQVFPGQSKTVTFTVPDHHGAKVHSKALQ
jgi:Family of unknown function (DUF6130)